MDNRRVNIPMHPQNRHIGITGRYIMLLAYCLFGLFTGAVMLVANTALFVIEGFLDLFLSLQSIPHQVNDAISAGNRAFLVTQEIMDEEQGQETVELKQHSNEDQQDEQS